jgi:hypothetical protein
LPSSSATSECAYRDRTEGSYPLKKVIGVTSLKHRAGRQQVKSCRFERGFIMGAEDHEYYAERMRLELANAAACEDNTTARARLDMAKLYKKRIDEILERRPGGLDQC